MNRALALKNSINKFAAASTHVHKSGMCFTVLNFSSPQQQTRFLQTLRKRNNPGFLDVLSGMYESPEYKLDCKPFEFREGEPFWFFNFLGTAIVASTIAFAFILCFGSLARYTLVDTQVVIRRTNPHPFLKIKTGTDMMNTLNPLWRLAQPCGTTSIDYKQIFYNEFNRASKHTL